MFKKPFRVKYQLHSIQTRSKPLFNKIKAYIITDSYKRFLTDGLPYKNNTIQFQRAEDEESRSIIFDERKNAVQNYTTISIQFNAEGRVIKMGQALINLADIINFQRNGQLLSYKLQKSYDKNAKVNVTISLWEEGINLTKAEGEERKVQSGLHSKSYCQLAKPKLKTRGQTYQNYKINITDYSQVSENDYDLNQKQTVSGKMNSMAGQSNTFRKKDFQKNIPAEVLQRQLIDAISENKIYQHEIGSLQRKFQSIQIQINTLKQKLHVSQAENYHLDTHCQQLKKQLTSLELSKQMLKEQLNSQVSKFSKMYQQSQKQRNKLLMQIDNLNKSQAQKKKDYQKQNGECRMRIKQLQRNEETVKRKIQQYVNQLSIYDKSLKIQKKNKEKVQHLCQQLKQKLFNKENQTNILQQEIKTIQNQKEQAISELQISKYSLKQFQKDVANLKKNHQQKNQAVKRLQAELLLSHKAVKQQRILYTKRLQEFQMKTEREQQNIQGYLQELQQKSMNEQSKNNLIKNLKKDIVRLKKVLQHQKQSFSQLQLQINAHLSEKEKLQSRLIYEQNKNMEMMKEKSILQLEFKKLRGQFENSISHPSLNASLHLAEEQKQQLAIMCYEQRDNYWRKQFQKIEKDFKSLMDKNKKEKQIQEQSVWQLKNSFQEKTALFNKKEQQFKAVSVSLQNNKRQMIQLQQKLANNQKAATKWNEQLKKQRQNGLNLKKKLQNYTQVQSLLQLKEKDILSYKNDLQRLKKENDKTVIMFKKLQNDVKDLVGFMNTYLMKNQKHKFYFQEFQCQTIDHQFVDIINVSVKHYCQRMNKIRVKLNQFQQLKKQMQQTMKRANSIKKSAQTFANEKNIDEWSFDSRISNISSQFKDMPNLPSSAKIGNDSNIHKAESTKMTLLKRQSQSHKSKLRDQMQHNAQLQKEIQRLNQLLNQYKQKNKKLIQQSDNKSDQMSEISQKLKSKEKSIDKLKEQCKQLNKEIVQMKNELQNANTALKNEKNQPFKRASNINRSYQQPKTDRTYDESYLKLMQMEAKYKIAQDDIQRLKKEKDQRRSDHVLQNRQSKIYQSKISEKQQMINILKKQIMEQKNNSDKLKETLNLKVKAMKEQYQTQLEQQNKLYKDQERSYKDLEEKHKVFLKKYKVIQDNYKNAEAKVISCIQKQEKIKKMMANELQLKIKAVKNEYQPQIAALKSQIQGLRNGEKSVRQLQKRKDKQMRELRVQLQRKDKIIGQLGERFDNLNERNKQFQQEQGNLKQVIKVLEDKIKEKCVEQSNKYYDKDNQKDVFQSKSNFSLKTFTFK